MKLTVFIPCFNERDTILRAVKDAQNLDIDKEIIVIDNGSSDGTREILESMPKDNRLKVVIHQKNMGVGYSSREGIRLASGEYFYAPCADLEYTMSDVYMMVKKLEEENLDAVFGSRLLARKGVSLFQLFRERPYWLGTIISTFLVNLFYNRRFSDVIATKVIKTSILKGLNCLANNQAFEFELVSRICKRGYRVGEVSVFYNPRTHKQGKTIKAVDIIPALWAILKVRFFSRK